MSFRSHINTTNKGLNSNQIPDNNKTKNKKRVSIQEQLPTTSDKDYENLSASSSIESSPQPIPRPEAQTLLALHSSDESGIESTESDSLLKTKSHKRLHKKY